MRRSSGTRRMFHFFAHHVLADLYSKQINESSSSFQGERVELLNNVSELQTQVSSLKNVC